KRSICLTSGGLIGVGRHLTLVTLGLYLANFRVCRNVSETAGQCASRHIQAPGRVNSRRSKLRTPAGLLVCVAELKLAHRHSLPINDLVRLEDSCRRFLCPTDLVNNNLVVTGWGDLPVHTRG